MKEKVSKWSYKHINLAYIIGLIFNLIVFVILFIIAVLIDTGGDSVWAISIQTILLYIIASILFIVIYFILNFWVFTQKQRGKWWMLLSIALWFIPLILTNKRVIIS